MTDSTTMSNRIAKDDTALTASHVAEVSDSNTNDELYERLEIPGKGQGLVARRNIKRGTRILSEKPLFVIQNMDPEVLNLLIACKLRSLPKDQQTQFLSLHNNFPGKHALAGIYRTNELQCSPGAEMGGVYTEICRINHSCRHNCHNTWNETNGNGCENIHARRDILAGEELTICYTPPGTSGVRQAQLKASYGFECNDERLRRIHALDEQITNPMNLMLRPLTSLHACRTLLGILREEYADPNMGEALATTLIPRLYYDALQIVVANGDLARARVFAERGYEGRVLCEGEDTAETQEVKRLMEEPKSHSAFGQCGMKWRTSKTAQPDKQKVGEESFEKWLWRL
ncbi:hypothetical protein PG997_013609 [Apiospora hydei]|uniref:SET domain-containing protein n=1 Tax=Apiospora hydei TaxID=1337664 RepID=A0ABR1V7E5_9PEZI